MRFFSSETGTKVPVSVPIGYACFK